MSDYDEVTLRPAISDIEKYLSVGTIVEDLEKVFVLYCEYAHSIGFSVRRGDQKYIGKDMENIKWKEFLCSAAGKPNGKRSRSVVPKYRKMITRTECKAKIRVRRLPGGPLIISELETHHNHPLVPEDQTYLLRSVRNLTMAHKSVIESFHSAGITVSKACGFLEKEAGGQQNAGFTRQDAYDHIRCTKRATKVPNGDATLMLEYFSSKAHADPYFFHKMELDDDGRLMNFFFRDSRCAEDYDAFGDVISLDTTYQTNRYNLICAPFIGINHHGNNVMFGIGFLSDETTSSFEWFLETFLTSMNGKQPLSIFTDQCQAMMNAIDKCFPKSRHRLCQWHINQKAPSHFGRLNRESAFTILWDKCMNQVETEEAFDEVWSEMVSGFGLENNSWFATLYSIRQRWAPVFTNGIFTAGMLATSRSEVTNRVLKEIVSSTGSLYAFIQSYEEIQERWRNKERAEDVKCMWEPGQFVLNNPLLSHAAKVYTRVMYRAFEFQFISGLNVEISEDFIILGDGEIQVSAACPAESEDLRVVSYNSDTQQARCSCRMFESIGMLCKHILRLYSLKHVRSIPEEYIMKRWSKEAKLSRPNICPSFGSNAVVPHILFVNRVMRAVYQLTSLAKDDLAAQQKLEMLIHNTADAMRNKSPVFENVATSSVACDAHLPFQDPTYIPRKFGRPGRKPSSTGLDTLRRKFREKKWRRKLGVRVTTKV